MSDLTRWQGQEAESLISSLKAKRVLFIFASPIDQGHMAKLRELIELLDALEPPPMVWAPHTVTPEIRPHNALLNANDKATVSGLP